MKEQNVTIVDAPEVILTEDEKAGDVLLKFYRALGWNGEDYLDPCKIRTTKEVYDRLYDTMYDKCPDPVAVGMTMVNSGPGIENYISTGKVYLLEGWITPIKQKKEDIADNSVNECPFNGDPNNDCEGCAYSGDYHFENGECVKRKDLYNTGADMWRENVIKYGFDEALTICGNYLEMNLKRSHSDDEKNFSRELFKAMYEATANNVASIKIVYPFTFEIAHERWEASYYHISRGMNEKCSRDITKSINDSCYEPNFYNLENAAWKMLLKYGFNRVCSVLAYQIGEHKSDGRYSQANKKWAQGFIIPDKAFDNSFMNAHATLVDGFTDYVRKLYAEMNAEQYALPGYEEHGEVVNGYEIYRAIMVNDDTGFAIAHNPNSVDSYVCWQFKVCDGKRQYNWGVYGSEQAVIDSFNARVFVNAEAENDNKNEGEENV